MRAHRLKLLTLFIVALLAVLAYSIYASRHTSAPSPSSGVKPAKSNEQQIKEENNPGATNVQPDVNTQEYKLAASNVSCSTTTINGTTSRNCSGNIQVTPRAQSDMQPAVYKINETTKLLHNGQEQDLNSLQQLSQSQTIVHLKLAAGSSDTLAEITY
jgi:hypothetical protein